MTDIKKIFLSNHVDKQQLLVKYACILAFTNFVYLFFWQYSGLYLVMPINVLFSILFLVPIFFQNQKIFTTSSSLNLILFFGLIEVFIIACITWHHSQLILSWLLLVPLFAFLFSTGRKAVYWSVPCISMLLFVPNINNILLPYILPFEHYDANKMQLVNLVSVAGLLLNILFVALEYAHARDLIEETLRKQNSELQNAHHEIVETQKYKDRFFANISHELRTPMNAIKGISELLENTEHNDEDSELIESLKKSSSHLLTVINDILDYSKIQEGKLHLVHLEFDLRDALNSSFNLLKYSARQKNIDYRFVMDNNVPKFIEGDPQRLKQILVNLLGNAIKFTSVGFVEMRCKIETEPTDQQLVLKIEVQDSGIGISKSNIDKIFEGYNQADNLISLKFGGTGLGLNISKKLIEMLNGSITCTSVEGDGSIFSIQIPFKKIFALNSSNQGINYKSLLTEIKPDLNILIADDNKLNCVITKKIILNNIPNANVDTCEDGLQAVELTQKNKYDIVLMDMQMPLLGGEGATKLIRSELENLNNKTIIIALTANVSEKDLDSCIQSGMNDFLTKPFELKDLIQKLHDYSQIA
jgi:signal transduction histidine kinase/ActR/RegA family two-component response regulator